MRALEMMMEAEVMKVATGQGATEDMKVSRGRIGSLVLDFFSPLWKYVLWTNILSNLIAHIHIYLAQHRQERWKWRKKRGRKEGSKEGGE